MTVESKRRKTKYQEITRIQTPEGKEMILGINEKGRYRIVDSKGKYYYNIKCPGCKLHYYFAQSDYMPDLWCKPEDALFYIQTNEKGHFRSVGYTVRYPAEFLDALKFIFKMQNEETAKMLHKTLLLNMETLDDQLADYGLNDVVCFQLREDETPILATKKQILEMRERILSGEFESAQPYLPKSTLEKELAKKQLHDKTWAELILKQDKRLFNVSKWSVLKDKTGQDMLLELNSLNRVVRRRFRAESDTNAKRAALKPSQVEDISAAVFKKKPKEAKK